MCQNTILIACSNLITFVLFSTLAHFYSSASRASWTIPHTIDVACKFRFTNFAYSIGTGTPFLSCGNVETLQKRMWQRQFSFRYSADMEGFDVTPCIALYALLLHTTISLWIISPIMRHMQIELALWVGIINTRTDKLQRAHTFLYWRAVHMSYVISILSNWNVNNTNSVLPICSPSFADSCPIIQ